LKATVVLACDDRFIPFACVVARQVVSHCGETPRIIIVSDNVSDENKALALAYCPQVAIVEAAPLLDGHSFGVSRQHSRAAYLSLFLDEILGDEDRVVYLDCDISLVSDISPLLAIVPRASPVVAAHDLFILVEGSFRSRLNMSEGAPYLNAGIMVLDLQAIRSEGILAAARQYAVEYPDRCSLVDQDALNAVLDGRWQTLDWRWNAMNYQAHRAPSDVFIRHFAGNKPWGALKTGVEERFVNEWRAHLGETPWPGRFQEQSRGRSVAGWFRQYGQAIEDNIKQRLYLRSAGSKGNRARMVQNYPMVLDRIARAAAAGTLAQRFPEEILLAG
jgi:lipopolysaccharide biosynthesis glycosyltransferase